MKQTEEDGHDSQCIQHSGLFSEEVWFDITPVQNRIAP